MLLLDLVRRTLWRQRCYSVRSVPVPEIKIPRGRRDIGHWREAASQTISHTHKRERVCRFENSMHTHILRNVPLIAVCVLGPYLAANVCISTHAFCSRFKFLLNAQHRTKSFTWSVFFLCLAETLWSYAINNEKTTDVYQNASDRTIFRYHTSSCPRTCPLFETLPAGPLKYSMF